MLVKLVETGVLDRVGVLGGLECSLLAGMGNAL